MDINASIPSVEVDKNVEIEDESSLSGPNSPSIKSIDLSC